MSSIESSTFSLESKNPELIQMADDISLAYINEALPILHRMVKEGKGRSVTNEIVQGRPDDDEIAIDLIGEHVIKGLIDRNNLPMQVYSEHADPFIGPKEGARLIAAFDPFDNSSEYKRGLPTPVYTCLSIYDTEGNPMSGVTADLKDGKVWIVSNEKVVVIDNFLEGTPPRLGVKSKAKSIREADSTVAMYTGSPPYFEKVHEKFRDMVKGMNIKGRNYANGGAHAPALIEDGSLGLYIMPDEPVEETAAGHAIAHFGGLTTLVVNERNEVVPFKFNPERFREDDSCLAVGATPEIAMEGINAFLNVS